MAALERLDRHVQHGHVIGHEERIELRPFERLRHLLDGGKVEVRIRDGSRIAPCAGVQGNRPHERAKTKTTPFGHRYLTVWVAYSLKIRCAFPLRIALRCAAGMVSVLAKAPLVSCTQCG